VSDIDKPLVVRATVTAGADRELPAVNVGDEWWTWEELGEALAETLAAGRTVDVYLGGERATGPDRARIAALVAPDREPDPLAPRRRRVSLFDDSTPKPPAAPEPVAEAIEADVSDDRTEALALLADCLPALTRRSLPADELAAACVRIRAEVDAQAPPWALVAAAAGWEAGPPTDDQELWLDAAACLVAPRGDVPLHPDQMARLGAMEFDDWLAAVIELTRSGAGTPISPQSLVALAARCMDVDSGAVDTHGAAVMRLAFEVLMPVWRAVGAVDGLGLLTALGEWGMAAALARAWGG
jgi:hypothetical protein